MKRYIKGSRATSTLLTSDEGNFSLVTTEGVGVNDTPWTGYEVRSTGLAEKHVVQIRIEMKNADYNGEPVEQIPYYVHIAYGMRSVIDRASDIREFIKVLQEALKFKHAVDTYFSSNIPGYKARD